MRERGGCWSSIRNNNSLNFLCGSLKGFKAINAIKALKVAAIKAFNAASSPC